MNLFPGVEIHGRIIKVEPVGQRNSRRRRTKKTPFNQNRRKPNRAFSYDKLEPKQLLAALFPTYVDGNFTLGNGADSAAPYDLNDTFKLESNPQATKTIYLDFDGHHSVDNRWGHDIQFPAFNRTGSASTFTDAELIEIQLQFQNVAEDFLPFDVNVTTKEPSLDRLIKSGSNDPYYGVRSVNTQATDGFGDGIGGIAYLNSFDDNRDNPVFAFNKGANNGAMTNSHEVGHALGLSHDGTGEKPYHPGIGSGDTGWGPIMGAPFGKNVTQWSNGDYTSSTQTQNDFEIITKSANGFGFRVDDNGNSFADATPLTANSTEAVFGWGIIEQRSDVDMYTFDTGGSISFSINPMENRPNLDVRAKIHDARGKVVAESNPLENVDAQFELSVSPGQYYLSIEGVGKPGEYSQYGSVGLYTLEGYLSAPNSTTVLGESGRLSINHHWTTVSLNHDYVDPVVVAGPGSTTGTNQMNVRVRNVTSNSFEIRIDEWDYLDSQHAHESVDYIVVESGEHTLSDGTVLVAGNRSDQTYAWADYDLGDSFVGRGRPVVLSQLVTQNEISSATTRMRFTADSRFQIQIEKEEAAPKSRSAETVSFIAIEQRVGINGDLNFESATTPNRVTHQPYAINFSPGFTQAPAFFASMQTNDGGDTATIRYRSLDGDTAVIFVEEERSRDLELKHTTEVVGFLAIELGDILGQSERSPAPAAMTVGNFPDLAGALTQQQSWNEMTLPLTDHDHQEDHVDTPGVNSTTCTDLTTAEKRAKAFQSRLQMFADRVFELSGAVDLEISSKKAIDSFFESVHLESKKLESISSLLRKGLGQFDRFDRIA